MNYKRIFKLLEVLTEEEDVVGDVYLLINNIENRLREKQAIEKFKEVAKMYFTDEEIEEILDGSNIRESFSS